MTTSYPNMIFKCPQCGETAEVRVSPSGQVEFSSQGAGMAYGIDDDPRKSTVLCGCSEDETGEKTEMKKISEHV